MWRGAATGDWTPRTPGGQVGDDNNVLCMQSIRETGKTELRCKAFLLLVLYKHSFDVFIK